MNTDQFVETIAPVFHSILGLSNYQGVIIKIAEVQGRPSSQRGKISYTRGSQRVRQVTRRFLTRVLRLNDLDGMTDIILDSTALNIDKLISTTAESFELLKGSDITEAYRTKKGGHSCMTEDSAYKTEMYALNPNRVRLLIVQSGNSSGRVLIWFADDKKLYYDRIYSDSLRCEDFIRERMAEWKIPSVYRPRHEGKDPVTVSGLKWNNGKCPYLDSLVFGKLFKSSIRITTKMKRGYKNIQTTSGVFDKTNLVCYCYGCGLPIFNNQEYYNIEDSTYICGECYNTDRYEHCDVCNDVRSTYNLTHMPDDRSVCRVCKCTHYSKCQRCDTWHVPDTMLKVGEITLCGDCLRLYPICKKCNTHVVELTKNELCIMCDEAFTTCAGCSFIIPNNKQTRKYKEFTYCTRCYVTLKKAGVSVEREGRYSGRIEFPPARVSFYERFR